MLQKEDRLEDNYDIVSHHYIEELIENWYSRTTAENTDDWRNEFVDKEYNIYLENYKNAS
jgi:hypothetical protein